MPDDPFNFARIWRNAPAVDTVVRSTRYSPRGHSTTESKLDMNPSDYRPSKLRAVLLGVATLALIGLSFLLTACTPQDDPNARSADPVITVSAAPTAPAKVLTVKDVVPTLDTTSRDCFGSAGCSLITKVKLTIGDFSKLGGNAWDVTYVIKGASDGPSVGTITVNPDHSYEPGVKALSTASSHTKLTVAVTKVEKEGL